MGAGTGWHAGHFLFGSAAPAIAFVCFETERGRNPTGARRGGWQDAVCRGSGHGTVDRVSFAQYGRLHTYMDAAYTQDVVVVDRDVGLANREGGKRRSVGLTGRCDAESIYHDPHRLQDRRGYQSLQA